MGEIADLMLSGALCECCGADLGSDGDGMPGYCGPACARARGATWWLEMHGYSVAKAPKHRKRRRKPQHRAAK